MDLLVPHQLEHGLVVGLGMFDGALLASGRGVLVGYMPWRRMPHKRQRGHLGPATRQRPVLFGTSPKVHRGTASHCARGYKSEVAALDAPGALWPKRLASAPQCEKSALQLLCRLHAKHRAPQAGKDLEGVGPACGHGSRTSRVQQQHLVRFLHDSDSAPTICCSSRAWSQRIEAITTGARTD